MALQHYGVLIGRPLAAVPEFAADSPHYQVHVLAANVHYRIAVNVKSNSDTNSELQYLVDPDFHHPIIQQLLAMSSGFNTIQSKPGVEIRGQQFAERKIPIRCRHADCLAVRH